MATRVQKLAKQKLRKFLYPGGRVKRGGLKCGAAAIGVSYGTIRKWALSEANEWIPSEENARRVLLWISTNPTIKDNTGTTRKPKTDFHF